ncbi:SUKH-3 domain-containing protein [Paenibacillus algorifonticola]|uniref:SUKH-3 domain-containing protein n=1 Tax=Paenibacillus algorifonticola TaxID=684063 RepID=UPI003D28E198
MSISRKTLVTLENAGWFEGRSIDIREIEENLKKLGYFVFEEVKLFLMEFGNLIIEDKENEEIHDTSLIFTDYYSYGSFKSEEKYAQENLVPVGKIDSGYLILFVSETGKVYCSTGKLGDSPLEAWENLISGNGGQEWE